MFTEYKAQVIKTYEKQRDEGTLSLNLQNLTPAKLRDECLNVINERYLKDDDKLLRAFFGSQNSTHEYALCIKNFDVDRFRPLVNFLKRNTNDSEDKNIELLSWLIDFRPRPYNFDHWTNKEKEEDIALKEDLLNAPIEKKEVTIENLEENNHKSNSLRKSKITNDFLPSSKYKKLMLPTSAIFILTLFISFLSDIGGIKTSLNTILNGQSGCMYWAADHYVSIDCDQTPPNVQAVASEQFRLVNFKKITKIDTLKEDCIGKIWYSKIDKKVEFFTVAGMHPEHQEKSLKLVTKHIYDLYILKKK